MAAIIPIPAFADNYVWLLREGRAAVVVDPGDAAPVQAYLDLEGLELAAIVATHHHGDHVGGIEALVARRQVPVYGPARETIPARTRALREGDGVVLDELGLELFVLDVPGHTAGHIAYTGRVADAPVLFCGDTLFTCGCGKIFEGTPEQLHHSLQRLASQPDDTLVYCTHEYTEYNTPFAQICEPSNLALKQWVGEAEALRQQNRPTVPTTLRQEKATNPFLRCTQAEIIYQIEQHNGIKLAAGDEQAAFTALRQWRDMF